jgi:hypothetical protein
VGSGHLTAADMTYALGPYGPTGLDPGADAKVMREGQALLEMFRSTLATSDVLDPWFAEALDAAGAGMEAGTRAAFREAGRHTSNRKFSSLSGRRFGSLPNSTPSRRRVLGRRRLGRALRGSKKQRASCVFQLTRARRAGD